MRGIGRCPSSRIRVLLLYRLDAVDYKPLRKHPFPASPVKPKRELVYDNSRNNIRL